MRTIVILNAHAGAERQAHGDATPDALQAIFGPGTDVRTPAAKELSRELIAAVAARPETLIVGGGDGTISAAAGALVGTGVTLGVLPLGTLNHFAKDLGLPLSWPEAAQALAGGNTREVDVGEVNGHVFLNNCSIGAYVDAVHRREALRTQRGHRKSFAMLLASLAVFFRLHRLRARITTPTQGSRLCRTPFVLVANNRYRGPLLAPTKREHLDAGQLWIYTTRAHRHGTLLRAAWQAIRRELEAADALDAQAVTEAEIDVGGADVTSLHIAADGELLHTDLPLRFRVRPRALRVLVPSVPAALASAP